MFKRNLDPCFFEIERNSCIDKVCLSDMTHMEQEQVLKIMSENDLINTCYKLAEALKVIGEQYNISFEEIVEN